VRGAEQAAQILEREGVEKSSQKRSLAKSHKRTGKKKLNNLTRTHQIDRKGPWT